MIIKLLPFRVPVRPGMVCWCWCRPIVNGDAMAVPEAFFCTSRLVRHWPAMPKLDAYQVRLSRYLVRRRARSVCDWFDVHDGLMHAGGVV